MEEFQRRVIAEKDDLVERIAKLEAFILGDMWIDVPFQEQDRLRRQASHMKAYTAVLRERIAAFRVPGLV